MNKYKNIRQEYDNKSIFLSNSINIYVKFFFDFLDF